MFPKKCWGGGGGTRKKVKKNKRKENETGFWNSTGNSPSPSDV